MRALSEPLQDMIFKRHLPNVIPTSLFLSGSVLFVCDLAFLTSQSITHGINRSLRHRRYSAFVLKVFYNWEIEWEMLGASSPGPQYSSDVLSKERLAVVADLQRASHPLTAPALFRCFLLLTFIQC